MTRGGWVRPWLQLVEISVSAPIVIGYRTAQVVAGGFPPDAKHRRELRRMVSEKASAFGRTGWLAVTTPPSDTARYLGTVLGPVHRGVTANRRRLIGH
jgi:hypothetical protein